MWFLVFITYWAISAGEAPLIEQLPNDAFTASSSHDPTMCIDHNARRTSSQAWCPANNNAGQYLQIDLGEEYTISAISTFPRVDSRWSNQFVKTYTLSYSSDGTTFKDYGKTFNGNQNANTGNDAADEARNELDPAINARFLRFEPITFSVHKSMRVEAYGSIKAYMHIGCYYDSWSRALRYGPQQYGYTIASCYTACPTYKYFALQHAGWCCCDNDLDHAKKYGVAPAGACPTNQLGGAWANDIFQKSNGVHYAFVTDKKTFSQAKEYCINSYPDGHLAVISDRDENEKVTEKCQNIGQLQAACWIGLTNPAISGNKWLDGTPITYTNWYDGGDGGSSQPCTTMRADGLWHTVGYCENGGGDALPFICEYTVSGAYSKPGLFLENLSFDSSGISMYWMYIIAILLFINVVCFAIYWCKCGKSSHQYKVVSVDSSDVEA